MSEVSEVKENVKPNEGYTYVPPSDETIRKFLSVSGFDYTDYVWWRLDAAGNVRLFVQCSDYFAWGCSDVEEIGDENIDSLLETVAECEEILGKWNGEDGFLLWCSRQRRMRPQGAYYKHLNEKLHPLFNEAGPAREIDLFNPKSESGEYLYTAPKEVKKEN